jgi:aspartyl-tRNA(Asn)/glutamyl-tRNA(Gln) amidotransferase subunit A
MNLEQLSLTEISKKISNHEVSSVEVTENLIRHIEKTEPALHSFITVTADLALDAARKFDEMNIKGESFLLGGVPIAIKDLLCTKNIKTTCASRMLENFVPPYTATAVEKIEQAGGIIIGKTNMDEFAMGSSTETSYFGKTRNPWDLDCVPGGSSGGSASSVAAHQAYAALGSDTGGSIRQPAAFCGIVGLKPTYGMVSRFGLIAFASSLDQVGPMTKTVEDAALLMNVLSGYDSKDSTSAQVPISDFVMPLKKNLKGMKIGVPKEFFIDGMDLEVKASIEKAITQLEQLGCTMIPVSLPHTKYSLSVYYIIAPAEASSNLGRYDGVRYGLRTPGDNLNQMYEKTRSSGFGAEVKRRIMLGTYTLSSGYYDAYYLKAMKVRRLIKSEFDQVFQKVDCLVTPTTPTPAFRFGEKTQNPLSMYLADIFTISINIAGVPAISIPCGFSKNKPIGLQLIGKPFEESTILQVAYQYEQSTLSNQLKPNLKKIEEFSKNEL